MQVVAFTRGRSELLSLPLRHDPQVAKRQTRRPDFPLFATHSGISAILVDLSSNFAIRVVVEKRKRAICDGRQGTNERS